MKIEIEKSEYDRLKSREEKLLAYYGWFVDKENDLATVEDIITENKKLKEERDNWKDNYMQETRVRMDECKKLEKENKNLKLTLEQMENTCKDYLNDRDTLREENKSLKEEIGKITIHSNMLESENKLFKEELKARLDKIKQLEERLDNKEKVNKQLREEIKDLNKMMLFETKI